MVFFVKRQVALFLVFLFVFSGISFPQSEFRTVVPGEEYQAHTFFKFFFGSDWRDLWTTPIEVKVLDLSTYAGGLTPIEKGGGLQTVSLRFKGKNGRVYKFRSVNKDPKKVLPEDMRESISAELLQDQISSAMPVAPLVVSPLLNAVGIPQPQPELYLMPDTELLGKFREEFAGMLGTLEIHPDEYDEETEGFAGSRKIVGSHKFFNTFYEKTSHGVDVPTFLKTRLIDMLVGDWDRHTDQWRWARYDSLGTTIWRPIPRDRDQAFAIFDGLVPSIGSIFLRQANSFRDDYPFIEDLMWSGRALDRRLLVRLTRLEWDSVTTYVYEHITDEVIENAVKQMPAEMYAKSGDRIIETLKQRRLKLFEASDEYFSLIMAYPDVYASDDQDLVYINRNPDGSVSVAMIDNEEETEQDSIPYFTAMYYPEWTKEIRILLQKEEDVAIVNGTAENSIPVYISGGTGRDTLIDNSDIERTFFEHIPLIGSIDSEVRFYDEEDKTVYKTGKHTNFYNIKNKKPENDIERYEPGLMDYASEWFVIPYFSGSSENGLIFGAGPVYKKYGFFRDPYADKLQLVGAASTSNGNYRVRFLWESFAFIEGVKTNLLVLASQLEVSNFFGFGNETVFDKGLHNEAFYQTDRTHILVNPSIDFPINKNFHVSFGGEFEWIDNAEKGDNSLLRILRPYGYYHNYHTRFYAGMQYDTRDRERIPQSGVLSNAEVSVSPALDKSHETYFQFSASARSYISTKLLFPTTLALRFDVKKIWNDFPYFKSAFLGGKYNLRGYADERFLGDGSLMSGAEIRMKLSKGNFILPATMGVSLFAETGRVFYQGENSGVWHSCYGGGVWLYMINPEYSFSFHVGHSPEGTYYHIKHGFTF